MNLILLKTLPDWLIIDTIDRYVILLMATLMNKRARNFLQRSFFCESKLLNILNIKLKRKEMPFTIRGILLGTC